MGKVPDHRPPRTSPSGTRATRMAAVLLAVALGTGGCGTPAPLATGTKTGIPAPKPETAIAPSPGVGGGRTSQTPSPTPSIPQDPNIRAVLFLKTSTNWYRDRLDQGHQYVLASDGDRFEAWWSVINQGSLTDHAQASFGDAADAYSGNEPQQVDDWSTLMGPQGEFQNAAQAWYLSHTEEDYAKVMGALDHADALIDGLAPGIMVPRMHEKLAIPIPHARPLT